jgi:hypothetical protein
MKGAFLPKFLVFVLVLFLGIMAYTWVEAKRADPVILDERGNVRP